MKSSLQKCLCLLVTMSVLAVAQNAKVPPPSSDVTTNGGTPNSIPLFSTSNDIENSILTQSGSHINVAGSVDATGSVGGNGFKIGDLLFAFGSNANFDAFLGFAGNKTMTGQGNTGVGVQALAGNTTGTWNTATGWQALASNTTAGGNTADGSDALAHNTTGYANTASGYFALVNNTTGLADTADGNQALQSNTIGELDTGSGFAALTSNTTGTGNTASGAQALDYNTTGNYNTAVGFFAGNTPDGSAVTGSENTFLGMYTVIGNGTLTNASAIGALAEVTQNNSMVLGSINGINAATSDTYIGIATTAPTNIFTIGQGHGQALSDGWTTYSSRRWKTNIQTLPDALEKVEKLRGVSYDLKDSGKHEVGVIAEEVGAVVPEVVTFEANGKDARGVDYSRLTALLIEAVKAEQTQIADLQSKLKERAMREAALDRRLAQLEQDSASTVLLTAAQSSCNSNGQ